MKLLSFYNGAVECIAQSHLCRKGIIADCANSLHATAPVRAENQSEEFAHEIIELWALRNRHLLAVGTTLIAVFDTASAYRAPLLGFEVVMTTRAFSFAVGATAAAKESASRDFGIDRRIHRISVRCCNWEPRL